MSPIRGAKASNELNKSIEAEPALDPAIQRAADIIRASRANLSEELKSLSIPTEDDAPTAPKEELAKKAYVALTGAEPSFDLPSYMEELAPQRQPIDLRDPLRTTDLGNAERFATQHHTRARFSSGVWFVWDGRRWKRDDTEAVRRLAKATIKTLYEEAAKQDERDERDRMARWAKHSESSKSISAMLREAQSDIRIATPPDRFDSPKTRYFFNCLNGTLDVRTGELKPHDPSDLISRLSPCHYDLQAHGDDWNKFLEKVLPDPEVRAFMQRFIGSALSGDTGDQQFTVFHGSGANGKSTFVSAILAMMGDYGKQANFETFLVAEKKVAAKAQARPDLMDLQGARFVAAVEAGAGRRLDEQTIKALTGGDLLTTRAMYSNQTTFQPECKIALVANNRPEIWGNNTAIWRRVLETPFTIQIPEAERDAGIKDKLTTSDGLAVILAWATLGALDWWERKANRLAPPEVVTQATRDYQEDENVIGPFLEQCTEKNENGRESTTEIWKKYTRWCESEEINPVPKRVLMRLLESAQYLPYRTNNSRGFKGLTLLQERVFRFEKGSE